jgi:hypothetical protein
MTARLLALFLAAAGPALSAGHEFEDLVKAIERHYGTHRTHIPLMGVANLFTKVVRPAGTSGFKLALFEGLDGRRDIDDPLELDQFMSGLTMSGLHPMVRAHSRHGQESTYIFAGDPGRTTKVFIATFERNQATLIEVTASVDILRQLLESPNHAASMFGVGS